MMSGSKKGGDASACAACKHLRRRCVEDCILAPYLPADDPLKFASIHKVFGVANVTKLLQEIPEEQRSDAVISMAYEANARIRNPVYGTVGAISSLQRQLDVLQHQLAQAQAQAPAQVPIPSTTSNSNSNPPTTTDSIETASAHVSPFITDRMSPQPTFSWPT